MARTIGAMPSDSDAESRSARLAPEAVARTTFPTAFRGYDPEHVRPFLERLGDELREARDREAALRKEVDDLGVKLESARRPDEAQLTVALGEETARVLIAAREAATEIRAKGEESVARLLREAQDEANRMKAEAEAILGQRTTEAEEAAAGLLHAVAAEVATIKAEAESAAAAVRAATESAAADALVEVERMKATSAEEAEAVIEAAKAEGREMVEQAMLVRARVLEDLSRKRKAARVQLERLQAGRERLLESYDIVRRTLDEATSELRGSLVAAKRVADAAARRVEAEPTPTVEQLEAELEAARDAGLPLVDDTEPEEAFDGELPDGEMVPIEASASFEEVRVVHRERDVEVEPVVVVDVVEEIEIDVVEVVEIVDEDEDAMTAAADVDVDDLFARIRAARAGEVAKAHEVLGDTPAAEAAEAAEAPASAAEPSAAGSAAADDEPDHDVEPATAADDLAPAPPTPDDQALLERRDAATDAAEQRAVRKLKRVLADEQNDVLDRMRRNTKATVDDLLPPAAEHAARYADAAAEALTAAAADGAGFYRGTPSAVATDVSDLARELGEGLALPLRDRVASSLRDAAGDDEALADGVRAAYRDWKTHRIGIQARDSVFAAFNKGLFDATSEGTGLRWLVDDGGSPCPDAEDNSLAGLVVKGEQYPTGHCYPPAHPGCRCLLVPHD
jgi:DivIVA domain-containing protein